MENTNSRVEYYPWSKAVLNQCLEANRIGRIPALDLELTAKCTGAYCIYCDSRPGVCDKENPLELDFPTLKQAVFEAKGRGLKWVYTCGLGEPLEDSKFWDLIQLFKEHDIVLSMFTNGVFIKNIDIATRLKECNVNIILKMDTFNAENFDKILGRSGIANKIYKARDLLLQAGYGSKDGKYTDLAFSIVPTSLSIDGIPEVISFCEENGIFPSVGELEQAGEVINNKLTDVLGINKQQILSLKDAADKYYNGSYMRPICPCILSGVHIDNIGNCVVDRDTGLNCKWFLLKDPQTIVIGNIRDSSIIDLFIKAQEYRKNMFTSRKDRILELGQVSYVFGGCGGNPKDIIRLAIEQYE